MSFRLKTIIGIAIIETVLLLVLIFTVLNFLKQMQSQEMSKRIATANQLLVTTAQDAIISSDLATLDSIVTESIKNPGIIFIRILDKNGNVLSQAGVYDIDAKAPIFNTSLEHLETVGTVNTEAVVKAHNVVFGKIQTGYSVAQFNELYDNARSQTIVIATTEIILVAIFSFFLGTYLTSQLSSLKQAAEQISNGNYLVNIQARGNDEIATTINAFNQMADRLDKLWNEQNTSYQLIQAVQEIQFEFIRMSDKPEFFPSLLAHILQLTQSEFGFIADVHYQYGRQYLKSLAISDFASMEVSCELNENDAPGVLEFHDLSALVCQPLLTKRPVMTKSPEIQPHAIGLPQGYPVLHSYMGIPLMHGDDVMGVIGLANRPGNYSDETLNYYDILWQSAANIIYAYRTEKAREQMQQKLSDRENFLSALFENVFDSIISIDEHGVITDCNSATSRMFGYDRNELVSKNIKLLMPEPFRGMHDFYLENRKKKPKSASNIIMKSRELVAISRDGEYIPIELSVSELYGTNGPSRYIGVIRDITDQNKYIDALQLANTKARETAKAKTDFLAMMSNVIRTPIHHVLDKLHAIDLSGLPTEQQQQLATAFQSSNLILDIIDEVQDFSRIDTGEIIFYDEHVDLKRLIDDVCAEYAEQITMKQLVLEVEYPESMPRFFSADRKRFRQILSKLLNNAVKFTDEGSITIRVKITDNANGFAQVTIEVIDTGIGIKPHKLKSIFEPFSRVNNVYTQDTPGSGLGLAICKRLVELLNGTITAHSRQGQGSTFRFSVPLEKIETN